jgi:hypothetical protein
VGRPESDHGRGRSRCGVEARRRGRALGLTAAGFVSPAAGRRSIDIDRSEAEPMKWWRAALVWLGLVLAETVHGILRALLLAPRVGDFHARQLAVFTGSAMIVAIAYGTVRWIGARSTRELLGIGSAWLVAMLAFEVSLGRGVMQLSWERILSDYDLAHGGLLPVGMVILALSPLVADRLRRRRERSRSSTAPSR